MTVHDKTERTKFEKRVVTVRMRVLIQLKLALVARYGHQKQAGKRPKISNIADLLAEVGTRAIWWRRLTDCFRRSPASRHGTGR